MYSRPAQFALDGIKVKPSALEAVKLHRQWTGLRGKEYHFRIGFRFLQRPKQSSRTEMPPEEHPAEILFQVSFQLVLSFAETSPLIF